MTVVWTVRQRNDPRPDAARSYEGFAPDHSEHGEGVKGVLDERRVGITIGHSAHQLVESPAARDTRRAV